MDPKYDAFIHWAGEHVDLVHSGRGGLDITELRKKHMTNMDALIAGTVDYAMPPHVSNDDLRELRDLMDLDWSNRDLFEQRYKQYTAKLKDI